MTSLSPAAAPTAGAGGWVVVVPVKRLGSAKSRLSTRTAPARRDLSLAFALDTVVAALAVPEVDEVQVVTADERVRDAVLAVGATWVADAPDSGLNDALRHAEAALRGAGDARPLAALAGDLPALRAAELGRALADARAFDRAFLPDAAGTGTTLLAARVGTPLDPRFGPRSCAAHAASGAVRLAPTDVPGLRRDVDTEVDLWDAGRLGLGITTARLLEDGGASVAFG